MQHREYQVRFVTPAFMGNAHQSGQWRTPPFKALLRQWWRVVAWERTQPELNELRQQEGELFGHAASKDSKRSVVRIRLSGWGQGKLTKSKWKGQGKKVKHPEVQRPANQMVGSNLYLGYGPVHYKDGLSHDLAIDADEHQQIRLMTPDSLKIEDVVLLIHWFGTVGGRSRNGWGSLALEGDGIVSLSTDHPLLEVVTSDWKACLQQDWPHAIGRDEQGVLIWETDSMESWEQVMQQLAELKIGFRTQFEFTTGRRGAQPEDRHLLAYPVTNHNPWGNSSRIANQVRFKVVKENNKYKGRIVHLPCGAPEFARVLANRQESVWQQVHQYLDSQLGRLQ